GAGRLIAGFHRLGRANDLAFGVEGFRGAGGAVEVEFGGNLHAGAAQTDDGGQHFLKAGAHAGFQPQLALFHGLGGDRNLAFARPRGQQRAGAVDDRDAIGRKPFDGGGDEVLDGADFAGGKLAAHGEDDRGRGLADIAAEQFAFGQDEVDASAFDAGKRADGAGEFALKGPYMIDVLDEARRTQRRP